MKLITETLEDVEYLTEASESGKKVHYIQGVFLQTEKKNRNGRFYPKSMMESEVARYTREKIDAKRAYGELSHPASPEINLDRVSHIITELKQSGNDYIGKARVTNTPMGNIVIGLLESGASLGVSSRGTGVLKPSRDVGMIVENYVLATAADVVADPSAHDAFVQGIMEDVEWLYDSKTGSFSRVAETVKTQIKSMTSREVELKKAQLFEKFMLHISNS